MLVTATPDDTAITAEGNAYDLTAVILIKHGSYGPGFYTTYQGTEHTSVVRMAGKHQTGGRYPTTYGLNAYGTEHEDTTAALTGSLSACPTVIAAYQPEQPKSADVSDGDYLMIGLWGAETLPCYVVQVRDDKPLHDPRLVFVAEYRDGAWHDLPTD